MIDLSASLVRGRRRSHRARLSSAPELLESRLAMSNVPFGAMPYDTGEYMLGSITVNVVAMESDGSLDPSTENWNSTNVADVKQRIQDAMNWWSTTLGNYTTVHHLDFTYDWTWFDDPIETKYEPINRQADYFADWVYDFLDQVGYNQTGDFTKDIRAFNNQQRIDHDTNWSFTIFVVNSTNDTDDAFAGGGSFPRAFAFAGGQLLVTPSQRPVSTYAHETGHIFWGFDEYLGGDPFTDTRGYFNTQNTNGIEDNTTPGFVHQASIMSNGTSIATSFANHTLPASTRASIGWQDSDGDGIFDVVDVPHSLTGAGRYDAGTSLYHFVGTSSVVPAFNRNSEGLQNDISIAKISRAQYRIDGGAWQTAATYNSTTANLDFTIGPLGGGTHAIDIRTIDDATGVTSAIFSATTSAPATGITQPGVNGLVWDDADADGIWDAGEQPLEGWTVQLVDAGGVPVVLQQAFEPDDYAQGTILNSVKPGVTMTAIGSGVVSVNVSARDRTPSSTGTKVFNHLISTPGGPGWSETWTEATRMLKVEFASPVSFVSIDAVGNSDGDFGRLDAYNAAGQLIGRMTSQELSNGEVQTLSVGRPSADIAYVIARGHAGTAVVLDNLCYGAPNSTVTGPLGEYTLPNLGSGQFRVTVTPPNGWVFTSVQIQTATLSGAPTDPAATAANVNFSFHSGIPTRPYQASPDKYNVNGVGGVTMADILAVANWLRFKGTGSLLNPDGSLKYTPITSFIDVSGDNQATMVDLLQLASYLRFNSGGGGGGGESSGGSGGSSGSGGGGGASGEAAKATPMGLAGDSDKEESAQEDANSQKPSDDYWFPAHWNGMPLADWNSEDDEAEAWL